MTVPQTSHGLLAAGQAEKRDEILELLTTVYWMELESDHI